MAFAFLTALALSPGAWAVPAAHPLDPGAWSIAFSRGMQPRPAPAPGGWAIDFPYPSARAGHVNYVVYRPRPLAGKRAIELRFRIDAAPGTRFVARETPELPATVSLFLQRRGDRMTRRYAGYRWYAPAATVVEMRPGEHALTVPLDHRWTSVLGEPASARPEAFRAALADTARIGLVFGTRKARGHGVYATGAARLTVTGFRII